MYKTTHQFIKLFCLSMVFVGCSKPQIANHVLNTKGKASCDKVYDKKIDCVDENAKVEMGYASYYASCLHGRPTASGESCNIHDYTAAHRSFPFGTIIRVTMIQNGKSVLVRVNDRGPYVRSRVVDLSHAAAKKIGLTRAGIAKVKIEQVKKLQ